MEELGIFGRAAFVFAADGQAGNGQRCVWSRVERWDEQTVCPQWRVNGLRSKGKGLSLLLAAAQRGQERSGRRRLSGMGCREREAS